jgi:hypothetical protein
LQFKILIRLFIKAQDSFCESTNISVHLVLIVRIQKIKCYFLTGYITANYQFLQEEICRVAPGTTPVRRRRGTQSQTPAKKIRAENGDVQVQT